MFNETNWMGGIETFKAKVQSPGGDWRLANTISTALWEHLQFYFIFSTFERELCV